MMILAIRIYAARLMCGITGHARGVRINELNLSEPDVDHFECPRCHTAWTRKPRKPKAQTS